MSEPSATTSLHVAIAGTLEFRDKDGNLIGTTEVTGSLPFTDADEAGEDDGLDNGS